MSDDANIFNVKTNEIGDDSSMLNDDMNIVTEDELLHYVVTMFLYCQAFDKTFYDASTNDNVMKCLLCLSLSFVRRCMWSVESHQIIKHSIW